MMGDAVDNIPGLPGVGAKTASKLLKQYGSLEDTLVHADEIKGKLGDKIRDNAELGLLSKKLARIILEVPIDLNLETLTRDSWDQDALMDLFEELEFRTLGRRLGLQRETADEVSTKPVPTNKVALASNDQMSLFAEPQQTNTAVEVPSGRKSISTADHLYQCVETLPEA